MVALHREARDRPQEVRFLAEAVEMLDRLVDQGIGLAPSAVGAEQRHIHRLVFGEGFRLIAGGVLTGLVIALLLSRVLKAFLFGVAPTDAPTLIGVAAVFAAVAMLACWVPTRRAGNVDPLEALRYE